MFGLLHLLPIVGYTSAALHHLYVGENEGIYIHALELNDTARTVYEMGMVPASGATPSLVLDYSNKYLFSSRPQDGTLTRYAVQADYSLKDEGSVKIPGSCNAAMFTTVHITSRPLTPYSIFGSASTGTCSTLFSINATNFSTPRSKDVSGNVHSLAWGSNGHLHALDSQSSFPSSPSTTIFNFRITENSDFENQNLTDVLANVTGAEQIVAHPTTNIVYIVSRDTNELITIPLVEHKYFNRTTSIPKRFKVLPATFDGSQFTTSTLAISASKNTLWTLSQSAMQAIISVFSLDSTTGNVINVVARAGWSVAGGIGKAGLVAAPFLGEDIIAVTNSPVGMVAYLGLETTSATEVSKQGPISIDGDGFLEEVWSVDDMERGSPKKVAVKIKSFGRIDLGLEGLGEGAWID